MPLFTKRFTQIGTSKDFSEAKARETAVKAGVAEKAFAAELRKADPAKVLEVVATLMSSGIRLAPDLSAKASVDELLATQVKHDVGRVKAEQVTSVELGRGGRVGG